MSDKEIKEKKKWLNRYSKLLEVETSLKNRLESLEDKPQGLRSSNFNGMPRGSLPVTMEDLIVDKAEIKTRIDKIHKRLIVYKCEILDTIYTLDEPKLIEVLELKYIYCRSVEEIAKELKHNKRHIQRLYAKALESLEIPIK